MYSATRESFTVAVGRDRKIWTAIRTNQIAGFVTLPSEKKIIVFNYQPSISNSPILKP